MEEQVWFMWLQYCSQSMLQIYILWMVQGSFGKQFDQLRSKVAKVTKIDWIDEHESLTFLHRQHGVRPTQIIVALILLVCLLVLVFDGSNIIASFACFVLPLLKCIDELSGSRKPFGLSRLNASNHNSHMTDEEFSQIMANNRSQLEICQSYTIYFVIYGVTEVVTPVFGWLLGSVSWLILRILLTLLLIAKQKMVTSRVLTTLGVRSQQPAAQIFKYTQ